MKRFILAVTLCLLVVNSHAQYPVNFLSIRAGGGIATSNNYNMGLTGGVEYLHGIASRLCIGADLMYQSYNTYYVNNAPLGNEGVTVMHNSAYAFFCPKIEYAAGRKGLLDFYLAPGVGFNMGGKETTTKWDTTLAGLRSGGYDSTINSSKNINTLVIRMSVGATEYAYLGKGWWFTFTEDLSFLGSYLSKTGTPSDESRTPYTPSSIRPGYLSLILGITHSKAGKHRLKSY